jgi:formamidopyrimidine-DNA glycosylase
VLGVRRRGKYLLLDLSEGLLLMHLGMSGSLRFVGRDEEPLGTGGAHDHFDLQTSRGLLRLHDPRRFGAVIYVPDEAMPWRASCLTIWAWSR